MKSFLELSQHGGHVNKFIASAKLKLKNSVDMEYMKYLSDDFIQKYALTTFWLLLNIIADVPMMI